MANRYADNLEQPGATADDWFQANAAPAPGGGQTGSGPGGAATYDDLQRWNQELYGGSLTDITPWIGQKDAYQNLANTEQAKAYAVARQAGGGGNGAAGAGGGGAGALSDEQWLDQKLQQYGVSPEERPYWLNFIREHGGVQNVGESWLDDAIHRADSSADVRSGAISRRAGDSGDPSQDLLKPFDEKFAYDAFKAPTEITEQNDPGYAARLGLVRDQRQRMAAAQGNLLSGTAVADLDKVASDYASNEYSNLYNREYQSWAGNYQKAFGEYNDRKATFYSNQDNPFAKLLAMSTLDSSNQNQLNNLNLGYAQLGANTITGGAARASDANQGAANANAAGQVASGNAYGSLYGNLSQIPMMYAMTRGRRSGGYQSPMFGY